MEYAATSGRSKDYLLGMRSLQRYKKTREYRFQLMVEERRARLAEQRAGTDGDRRRARLRAFECSGELACLEQGDEPSAFHGLIRFQVPAD